jgi:branched-subunit amino acid aminotransferase/4-amino-4-deoxychorismate lyase
MATFLFDNQELVEIDNQLPILVADSMLLSDGKIRSLDKHIVRFVSHAQLRAPELLTEIPEFLAQVIMFLPKTGNYFPRLEIRSDKKLYLNLRDAPKLETTAVLWTYPEADPRTDLAVKGPELAAGTNFRDEAIKHGADEAIMLNSAGFISEGALSSLVWWEDDVLTAPGDEIPWLESITRTEVFEIAAKLGLKTQTVNRKPEDLIDKEVWLLSSLHGIRTVIKWVRLSDDFKSPEHKELFDQELAKLVITLP